MCILPLIALLVASEAIVASEGPQRSKLTSEIRHLTSIVDGRRTFQFIDLLLQVKIKLS